MDNKQRGFTLIEMIVVMLIVSLTLSYGVYHWHQQQQRIQLIETANRIAYFIHANLIDGIYLNLEKILKIVVHPTEWQLTFYISNPSNSRYHINSGAQHFEPPFEDIQLYHANRTNIHFYGKEGTSYGFSLSIQNSVGRISVIVSALGRIRLCSNFSNLKIRGIAQC